MKKIIVIAVILFFVAELLLVFCNLYGIPLSEIKNLPDIIIQTYRF